VTRNGVHPGLVKLRPYQTAIGRAILNSITNRHGLTFTVEMSRQSGKNELSAQLEATLLSHFAHTTFAGEPFSLIKAAPTFSPQTQISIRRLKDTLRTANVPHATDAGHIIRIGHARAIFLSAEPNANVVGHTANPLLEIDEAQDIDIEKFDKEFRPMAAHFNATTVLYGTPWSELDLLHRERRAALDLEAHDNVHRAWAVPWPIAAAENPAYHAFVTGERSRLGPTHPSFTTQYDLIPLPSAGRLFSPDNLAQLAGDFPRRRTPPPAATIAAGLDIAGGSDAAPDAHDRTVLTLAAVSLPSPADPIPANHIAVLHQVAWQGEQHERLLPQLLDLINNVWKPAALTIDATGIGETTARILTARSPRTIVNPYKFTRPSKSALAYDVLTAVTTGRLKLYEPDGSDESTTCWNELRAARADYLPGQLINFYVDPTDGHDDYLISLSLAVHAANQATPRIARGR
jgi:hypothetical protein